MKLNRIFHKKLEKIQNFHIFKEFLNQLYKINRKYILTEVQYGVFLITLLFCLSLEA